MKGNVHGNITSQGFHFKMLFRCRAIWFFYNFIMAGLLNMYHIVYGYFVLDISLRLFLYCKIWGMKVIWIFWWNLSPTALRTLSYSLFYVYNQQLTPNTLPISLSYVSGGAKKFLYTGPKKDTEEEEELPWNFNSKQQKQGRKHPTCTV